MKISEVAEQIGVTTVTLRYYERVGLVPPIERKNNVRVYKQADLNWIEFIKCMRDAGLSVDSLSKYTSLYQLGNETIEDRKDILVAERESLEKKYLEMGNTLQRLNQKIEDYDNGKFFQPENCS
ncbi:MerR family transcriptional regulator [Tetragenococcus osmophilus]|uniref:HTH-type transcriptional regulator AdhR n=1 Tax=Tetragenococcus osmophilus TaxID=526944 RepID=A0AA37XLC5_9ENTE|nr:MerR family transcriptional regulator [Tetragenococcus osmophilus]AYW48301.1 MerR family transcriptional regulator [Tetragenococcus osmophilus]GMA54109.1 HTH-type transcriptional regulator AdhR [Alicyclobacillus contaminans]GMA72004.1 HTH-type transcriptional regulator AdhR [Tetragenococcus osmophilus]